MAVSGVIFGQLPYIPGAGKDTLSLKPSLSGLSFNPGNQLSGEICLLGSRDFEVSIKPRKFSGFSDDGHLQYYTSPRCGGKKEKVKDSETQTMKKKLKLIKGLSRDLSKLSIMGLGLENEDGLIKEVKGKKISEATEILLSQLRQLRAEEKEMKRKRKEEKAKLKEARLKAKASCDLSSVSSESDCDDVVEMSSLRNGILVVPKLNESSIETTTKIQDQKLLETEETENLSFLSCRQECSSNGISSSNGGSVMVGKLSERIEVCMGGKCKKSGSVALMEEFEKRVGIEGAVIGCKCMGKCRDGPNVRVLSKNNGDLAENNGFVKAPSNPLCIGVGLEDVGVIVANFFGEERMDLGLMAA